jgi:integrase
VHRNVATFAETPRVTRPKVKPWEPEQLGHWLDTIIGERLYPLYHLAAFTGLRRGELCGLSWDDVNLDAERVVVWSQITGRTYRAARAAEKQGRPRPYRTRVKTSDGEARIVDLDKVTVDVLGLWRKKQVAERLAWGAAWSNRENLVFTRQDGSPIDPDWVYKNFVRLVKRSGIPVVPLHHLRQVASHVWCK